MQSQLILENLYDERNLIFLFLRILLEGHRSGPPCMGVINHALADFLFFQLQHLNVPGKKVRLPVLHLLPDLRQVNFLDIFHHNGIVGKGHGIIKELGN